MKLSDNISDSEILISQYVEKCGCKLHNTFTAFRHVYIMTNGKRERRFSDPNDACKIAMELSNIHKLEGQLENEKDFKKRRLIKSHLYFIDSMPE